MSWCYDVKNHMNAKIEPYISNMEKIINIELVPSTVIFARPLGHHSKVSFWSSIFHLLFDLPPPWLPKTQEHCVSHNVHAHAG
jgi:hypothetical protein